VNRAATEIPGPISSSQSVARSAGVTSIAVLASRITGLVREIALAHFFGATAAYDAYILGFRIPNLTRDLFAEGALSSAFVPTFVDALHKKSKEDAAISLTLSPRPSSSSSASSASPA